MQLSIKLG